MSVKQQTRPHFRPIITEIGLQRLMTAAQSGAAVTISHVALGDTGWSPTASATELQHECYRTAISGTRRMNDTQQNFTFIVQGESDYWIREIGLILDDGTLFAVWSDTEHPLAWKAANVNFLLGYDLVLTGLPSGRVENCRAHHYDHVSSPRSSNRTCATNASGFRSKCHAFALDTSAMVCAIL